MRARVIAVLALLALVWVGAAARGAEYAVDKREVVPNLEQKGPTCGLLSAALNLAGAGWGEGADAEKRAANIYGLLCSRWPGGAIPPDQAMEWYLKEYGCTGQSPYYSISKLHESVGFSKGWYEYMLDELARCQFVSVSWHWNSSADQHSMALVAGDHCYTSDSVWRDGNTAAPDDVCDNTFPGEIWHINRKDPGFTVPPDAVGIYAEILCPGKPKWAIAEYDVQWTRAAGLEPATGAKVDEYGQPCWRAWDPRYLDIGNERVEDWHKELFLELTFTDPQDPDLIDLTSLVFVGSDDPLGTTAQLRDRWHWYEDDKKALAKFVFEPQPASEWVAFDQWLLDTGLDSFNLATYCSPEPATLAMLLAGLGLAAFARRRRQRERPAGRLHH